MKKKYVLKKIKKFFKSNIALLLLVLTFFVVKCIYLLKAHVVIWDEAVYMGMGKYMMSCGELGFWEIIRPAGLPFLLGLIWKSGLNYVAFSEFLSILFSTGNLVIVYLIGKELFNKKVGIISSFILAITSVYFLYTNYILTGMSSAFFVLSGIYIYIKRKNLLLSGVLCGLGALFRFPQGIIVISFIILFFIISIRKKDAISFMRKTLLFTAGFFLIHIPFFIFNYIIYNKETSKIYHALFRPWILGMWHQSNPAESVLTGTFGSYLINIFYYIINLFKENTLLFFIIPGLILFFRKKLYRKEGISLVVVSFFVYLIYFTLIANKQVRFLIVFLPFAAIIAAYGFYHLFTHVKKDRWKVLIILFVLVSIAGVGSRDLNYYEWRQKEDLPIVKEYYKYFEGKEIKGPILTTDPVPVAYVDAKFIPFYFSPELGYEIYDANKETSYATIFSLESFYCGEDAECKTKLKKLKNAIAQNEEVFSKIYGDRNYYIYLNRAFR